nr:SprT family zinc-dependent metalloprotease [Candidatus Sigynarchaeota archaeon]
MKTPVETREFNSAGIRFTYKLARSRRKTIGITIRPDCSIIVHAPKRVDQAMIDDVLLKKRAWIEKKLTTFRDRERDHPMKISFSPGDKLLYLGEQRVLDIQFHDLQRSTVFTKDSSINVIINRKLSGAGQMQDEVKKAVTGWYRGQARAYLEARIDQFKATLGVEPARMAIKDQKTRWGSCSSKGNVNFNWRLLLAPPSIIDYVVIHELCHLKLHSHSAKFWTLVGSLVPDFKARRKWLKENGHLLSF